MIKFFPLSSTGSTYTNTSDAFIVILSCAFFNPSGAVILFTVADVNGNTFQNATFGISGASGGGLVFFPKALVPPSYVFSAPDSPTPFKCFAAQCDTIQEAASML